MPEISFRKIPDPAGDSLYFPKLVPSYGRIDSARVVAELK